MQQIKVGMPEFFSLLEDTAQPAIEEFLASPEFDDEAYINILFYTDVNIDFRVKICVTIKISQGNLVSKPLYESEFYDNSQDVAETKMILLLLDYMASHIIEAKSMNIHLILPNSDLCSEHDLTTEIKRSVEWFYCINSARNLVNYKKEFEEGIRSWREICVRMNKDKKISLEQANVVVMGHLHQLIAPYAKLTEGNIQDNFEGYQLEPMEQALAIRLMLNRPDFLEKLSDNDADYICRFLWSDRNAATYKSKVDLFQKYITNEILKFSNNHYSAESEVKLNIFNITEVLPYNERAITRWILTHKWTDDELQYITKTFGNGGYQDQKHYLLATKTLGMIFDQVSNEWKEIINQFVFDGSELEEMHEWARASKQELPSLALQCIVSKSKHFESFGKGIILYHGLRNTIPLLQTKEQVRIVCALFDTSPEKMIEYCPSQAEKAMLAVTELIIESF